MAKRNRTQYKDLGLEIAIIFGRYFFHTDHLHYGYWPQELPVHADNLLCAQQNYCKMLLSRIPVDTKTILEVGCGTGKFAEELKQQDYSVDCVSPSALLTSHARKRLGEDQTIFECKYEDLETDKRYDLILFSESFQYVPLDTALRQCARFLAPGGRVLISDFFSTDVKERSPLGGGHVMRHFYAALPLHHFEIIEDTDITAETAPNLDLVSDLYQKVIIPIGRSVWQAAKQNYPTGFRVLSWIYRKKIAKLRRRYTGNARSGANFLYFKSYRVILLAHQE